MAKAKIEKCQHCGDSHTLTVKALKPPIGILKARVTSVATCPATRLPILGWEYDSGNEVIWPS